MITYLEISARLDVSANLLWMVLTADSSFTTTNSASAAVSVVASRVEMIAKGYMDKLNLFQEHNDKVWELCQAVQR